MEKIEQLLLLEKHRLDREYKKITREIYRESGKFFTDWDKVHDLMNRGTSISIDKMGLWLNED